ncbi:hypothetical protein EDB19DRAFT_1712079 [Suillus lakei]|nr:hypothetical protein EDB19DRAFT_1712079 [Suillus lakei]
MFCLPDFNHIYSSNPALPHLTNVVITVCQPNILLRLLQLAPNLSSVTMEGSRCFIQPRLEPLTHANLQSLRTFWSKHRPERLVELFNALTLPNLRELEACSAEIRWPHVELKAFLARSKCPLESLIFGDKVTTASALEEQRAEYITLIPSLGVVTIQDD